eukprot:11940682-Ditylum_brightwellii.AAC.1
MAARAKSITPSASSGAKLSSVVTTLPPSTICNPVICTWEGSSEAALAMSATYAPDSETKSPGGDGACGGDAGGTEAGRGEGATDDGRGDGATEAGSGDGATDAGRGDEPT